jgi:hypothetical protein
MRIPWVRIILTLAGIAIGLILFWPRPDPPAEPIGPRVPTVATPSHVRQDVPATADRPADRDIRGKVRLKVRTAVRDSTTGEIRQQDVVIDVVIPNREESTPIVEAPDLPGGVMVVSEYQDFRDPFFSIRLHLLAGASVDPAVGPSPYAAVTILTIAERVRLGVGADRWGVGPAAHWEFFREFNVGARWQVINYSKESTAITFSISYRL